VTIGAARDCVLCDASVDAKETVEHEQLLKHNTIKYKIYKTYKIKAWFSSASLNLWFVKKY
jgi:hypothetical protein